MADYPSRLDGLWTAHCAGPGDDAPTLASLFSGAGGSSVGYSGAGYRELLASEWDATACQVFRANFPGVALHQGDVADLDPAELGLAPGALSLLAASPPCQAFSTVGLRGGAADPRGGLWREVTRLAAAWRPRVVAIENVSGLAHPGMRPVFAAICSALTGLGCRVQARLVDASQLGIPQRRVRVFILAVRNDLGAAPVFPVPFSRPVTVREAWAGLGDPGEYAVPEGKGARLAPLIAPGLRGLEALRDRGGKPSYYSATRLAWDRPARTIVRDIRVGTSSGYLHPDDNRFAGVRELARLQSFPDAFDWCGLPYTDCHHLIGNSVCPLVAEAVGRALLPLMESAGDRA